MSQAFRHLVIGGPRDANYDNRSLVSRMIPSEKVIEILEEYKRLDEHRNERERATTAIRDEEAREYNAKITAMMSRLIGSQPEKPQRREDEKSWQQVESKSRSRRSNEQIDLKEQRLADKHRMPANQRDYDEPAISNQFDCLEDSFGGEDEEDEIETCRPENPHVTSLMRSDSIADESSRKRQKAPSPNTSNGPAKMPCGGASSKERDRVPDDLGQRFRMYHEAKTNPDQEGQWVSTLLDDIQNWSSKRAVVKLVTDAPSGRANIKLWEALTERLQQRLNEAWNYEIDILMQLDLEKKYDEFMKKQILLIRNQNETIRRNASLAAARKNQVPTQQAAQQQASQPSQASIEEGQIVDEEETEEIEETDLPAEKEPRVPIGYMIDGLKGSRFKDTRSIARELARIAPAIKFSKVTMQPNGGVYIESKQETRAQADELFLTVGLQSDAFESLPLKIRRPGETAAARKPEDARKVVVLKLDRAYTKEDVVESFAQSEVIVQDAFWLTRAGLRDGKMCILFADEAIARDYKSKREVPIDHCYYNCEGHMPKEQPLRCFKCQKFEHYSGSCPGEQCCLRCGVEGHSHKECVIPITEIEKFKCRNCGGKHAANSKSCDVYIKAKKELDDKIRKKIANAASHKDAPPPKTNYWHQQTEQRLQAKVDSLIAAIITLVQARVEDVDQIREKVSSILC